jgi:hypothetical protein
VNYAAPTRRACCIVLNGSARPGKESVVDLFVGHAQAAKVVHGVRPLTGHVHAEDYSGAVLVEQISSGLLARPWRAAG